jgi:hypothetical protein
LTLTAAFAFVVAGALAQAVPPQPPLVAVRPISDARCPSPVEVEAALLARVPGVVVAYDRATERRALLLSLASSGEGGGSELVLTDLDGRVRLRRQLSGAGEKKACAALAETAALMVERYLVELDERAALLAAVPETPTVVLPIAPPPPPEPRWSVGLGSGYAMGSLGGEAVDLGLRATRQVSFWGLVAMGRFGVGPRFDPVPAVSYNGRVEVRRFPLHLGLGRRRGFWRGDLEGFAGAGLDMHHVQIASRSVTQTKFLLGPHALVDAGFRAPVWGRLFARIGIEAAFHLKRYNFARPDGGFSARGESGGPLFSLPTRRVQARLATELGVLF